MHVTCNYTGLQLSYNWLLKTPVKAPVGGASKIKKIRDRVDSEGKYGRGKLRVILILVLQLNTRGYVFELRI